MTPRCSQCGAFGYEVGHTVGPDGRCAACWNGDGPTVPPTVSTYFYLFAALLRERRAAGGRLTQAREAELLARLDSIWHALSDFDHEEIERCASRWADA